MSESGEMGTTETKINWKAGMVCRRGGAVEGGAAVEECGEGMGSGDYQIIPTIGQFSSIYLPAPCHSSGRISITQNATAMATVT